MAKERQRVSVLKPNVCVIMEIGPISLPEGPLSHILPICSGVAAAMELRINHTTSFFTRKSCSVPQSS